MKFIKESAAAMLVVGVIAAGSMDTVKAAPAVYDPVHQDMQDNLLENTANRSLDNAAAIAANSTAISANTAATETNTKVIGELQNAVGNNKLNISNLRGDLDAESASRVDNDKAQNQILKSNTQRINDTEADLNLTKDAVILVNHNLIKESEARQQDIKDIKSDMADKVSQTLYESDKYQQITKNEEQDRRIILLETADKPVNGTNGKDGLDGKDGKNGTNGKDGLNGKDGQNGTDGKDGLDGKDGKNGTNGKDGLNGKDGKTGAQGIQGIKGDTGVAGIAGKDGKNGLDGKDGTNGVTTTVIKKEVDSTTINRVNLNTQNIKAVSETTQAQAQDLKEAKQFISQAQATNNNRFQSLKDEVDSNKQEARGGVASAIAIASMPQVQAGETFMISAGTGAFKDEQAVSVGASFHAGEHTIVKAGVSDSTNNDFAMGAGIGIGF